ncbi:MAG: glycosyltransferase [Acidimicrobiales bacterium]
MDEVELSVVVPCHNAARTLSAQLDALTAETWDARWEIIVVDNASTDGSADIARSYGQATPPVRVLTADRGRGAAYARNVGAAASTADSIAFCDADDVIQPGWVAAVGGALRTHPFVSSRLDTTILNRPSLVRSRPVPSTGLPEFGGLTFAHGGACGMRKSVWDSLGGYDLAFDVLEDIELSLRARAAGIVPVCAPDAVVAYRLRDDLASVWRQGFSYGRRRPQLQRRAADLGLTTTGTRQGWKSIAWLVLRIPTSGVGGPAGLDLDARQPCRRRPFACSCGAGSPPVRASPNDWRRR